LTHRQISRRTWLALPALGLPGLLGACGARNMNPGGLPPGAFRPGAGGGAANFAPRSADRAALLVPLSGQAAGVGDALRRGAELALAGATRPRMSVYDTGSTPDGAANAARRALGEGAGIILGPLTAGETAAVAGAAGGTPVLAFTSDVTQARPNVWVMGLTPEQQVRRMVAAASAANRRRYAALLPEGDFGAAMGAALDQAVAEAGGSVVRRQTYGAGFNALNVAAREVANYAGRRGPLEAQVRALRGRGDAAGRRAAAAVSGRAVPPPDFDCLLVAETGARLAELGSLLPYYDIDPPAVQIMGPALWANDAATLAQESAFRGAWFAAPDPGQRSTFVSRWRDAHGSAPPPLASIGYDTAGLVRDVAERSGVISPASLSASSGFAGADGTLSLTPDGRTRRSLALFTVDARGPRLSAPAAAGV
jgi:hypothetical protein